MAVPVATTRITIRRPLTDGYDDPTYTLVASGVRATINETLRAARSTIGQQEQGPILKTTRRLQADPCDLQPGDLVLDEVTGVEYTCALAGLGPGLIPHMSAELLESRYLPRVGT